MIKISDISVKLGKLLNLPLIMLASSSSFIIEGDE